MYVISSRTHHQSSPRNHLKKCMSCHDCTFTYIGESRHLWSLCWAEYDPDHAIKQISESMDHSIYPRVAQFLEYGVTKLHSRLFLDSWYSTLDNTIPNCKKLLPWQTTAHRLVVWAIVNNINIAPLMNEERSRQKQQKQNWLPKAWKGFQLVTFAETFGWPSFRQQDDNYYFSFCCRGIIRSLH